ncbi:hypothetical protein KIPB_010358 [Kipferlia bialata]|uniref:Uncharacterized protein n=1 Tax=Kipferlia bialata TaxID=797122 RepID=A0A391NS37_9EUKA|nr:hypothetical protein KIPB_010358 [Kipferlia bialata]|eukprot:g10358.t1
MAKATPATPSKGVARAAAPGISGHVMFAADHFDSQEGVNVKDLRKVFEARNDVAMRSALKAVIAMALQGEDISSLEMSIIRWAWECVLILISTVFW